MHRKLKTQLPFNDAGCLEVEYREGKWARVTPNHFRSFTGARRINGELYDGPIYFEGTNFKYMRDGDNDTARIVNVEELNKRSRKLKPIIEIVRLYDRDAKYKEFQ